MSNFAHKDEVAFEILRYNRGVEVELNRWIDAGRPVAELMQGEGWVPAQHYQKIVWARDVNCDAFSSRNIVSGVGVAMLGVVGKKQSWPNQLILKGIGSVHTLTALVVEDFAGKKKLGFRWRLNDEVFSFDGKEFPLAGDFTAGLAFFKQRISWEKLGLFGLFRPGETNLNGLYFTEPYDKRKFPLVLIHGLGSTPETFSDLVNHIRANPFIRHNFQIWYFAYPTGDSWMRSSATFRETLNSAMEQFSPQSAKPAHMLVVAHSMGGLVTQAAVSQSPWMMLREFYQNGNLDFSPKVPPNWQVFPINIRQEMKRIWGYSPLIWVDRVVFMSTPHNGSLLADSWYSLLGQKLIQLPVSVLSEVRDLMLLNGDILKFSRKDFIYEWNGVSQLAPKSPFILGLNQLTLKKDLITHTILGDRGCWCCPACSDGVVAYWSSHFPPAISEFVAPCGHSSPENKEAQREVLRICLAHLRGIDGGNRLKWKNFAPTISIARKPVPMPLPQ